MALIGNCELEEDKYVCKTEDVRGKIWERRVSLLEVNQVRMQILKNHGVESAVQYDFKHRITKYVSHEANALSELLDIKNARVKYGDAPSYTERPGVDSKRD